MAMGNASGTKMKSYKSDTSHMFAISYDQMMFPYNYSFWQYIYTKTMDVKFGLNYSFWQYIYTIMILLMDVNGIVNQL